MSIWRAGKEICRHVSLKLLKTNTWYPMIQNIRISDSYSFMIWFQLWKKKIVIIICYFSIVTCTDLLISPLQSSYFAFSDLGTKGSLKFIEDNFKRHYTTNRAPFGIFIHATWFGRKDGNLQGLVEFLASLADKEDVWVVTVNQALDWIQHPVKLSALNSIESWAC